MNPSLGGDPRRFACSFPSSSPPPPACPPEEGLTGENVMERAPAPGKRCPPAMCRDLDGRPPVFYMHRHTAIEHLVLELDSGV